MKELKSDKENKDDEKGKNYISKRTITEVYDVKEGEFINSDEFFKRDEAEIMAFRRHLEEAIALNEPRFICPFCKQMVKICGRRTSNHKAVYFSHLYDSDDCEKKTTTQLSADYILAKKYGMIQESERHKKLKTALANYLQTEKSKRLGFSNVKVSTRIKSDIPYLNWRCPDVYVEFNGKKIVFELQLSTYFISVLVARDIFYRLNGYYIIWVFNFDNNYITQESLFTKDYYYSNKLNLFIFDEKAQKKSKDENMLYLNARYLDTNNKLSDAQLISMLDLKFDETTFKPYFYNAETDYYLQHPDLLEKIKELERSTEDFHRGLMKRQQEEEENKKAREEKSAQMREHMKACGGVASIYKNGRRFGYKFESTLLTESKYTFAEEINNNGFAIVKNNNKFGIVNQYGEEVMLCVCKEIHDLRNGLYLINHNRQWSIWNKGIILGNSKPEDEVTIFTITKRISAFNIERANNCEYSMVLNREATQCINCQYVSQDSDNLYLIYHDYSENEYITAKGHIFKQKSLNNNKNVIIAQNYFKQQLYGLLNNEYIAISPFKYTSINFISEDTAKVQANDKFGIITYSNLYKRYKELIPCIYEGIQPIKEDYYLVQNNGLCGIIETTDIDKINLRWLTKEKFAEIVPCIYEQIVSLQNGYYTVKKEGKLGLIKTEPYKRGNDNFFTIIIPCIYESIQLLSDKYFAVRQESQYGVINIFNETIIQPAYDSIKLSEDGTFYVKSEGKTGHFDSNGNALIDNKTRINDIYTIGCFWGNYGIFATDGSTALSFKYKDIHCLNEYLIVAIYLETKESGWYYNKEVIEHIELYDYELNRILGGLDIASIVAIENGNFNIQLFNGISAQLSSTGTLIKENVSEISDMLFKYRLFGHWGIIDSSGNNIQPNIWNSISLLNNKNILLSKDDEVCLITPSGEVLADLKGKTFDSMLGLDLIKLRNTSDKNSQQQYYQASFHFDIYTASGVCICEHCSKVETIRDGNILYQP